MKKERKYSKYRYYHVLSQSSFMCKVLTRERPCKQMLLDSAVKNINKAYISYFTFLNMLSNYYLIRIK